MADRRKDELNGYVWHLVHAAPEVAQCDLIYTFFHPLQRDEKPGTVVNTLQSKPAGTQTHTHTHTHTVFFTYCCLHSCTVRFYGCCVWLH
ncbi:unnamed protein product [Oncorhynchus mykiss]|uniref:Uncharacterized protein n=1 Tax=Oncorhynchus mykiss TaxID=8022 RepID=A0A060Y1N1_ONCMY|nr:unnamed protein product [Oncorhynchus mykiss]